MSNNLELVQQLLAKKLDIEPSSIKLETTLEELELDSLDVFDLMFEAEDKLKIVIPNNQTNVKTIQDLVNILDKESSK